MITQPGTVAVGHTRFGGEPDLPSSVAWPTRDGKPMGFLAQLAMTELAPLTRAGMLPPTGLLSFFHSTADCTGSDSDDAGGWSVIHVDGHEERLDQRKTPAGVEDYQHYRECGVRIQVEDSLPAASSKLLGDLGLADRVARDSYEELRTKLAQGVPSSRHRMFGWPDQVQEGAMRIQVELLHREPPFDDPRKMPPDEIARLNASVLEWCLLLQVDSDDNTDMMFVDMGRMYFWIRKQDLAARRFDRVWCIVQFH